jgi:hypothetical protein
VPIVRRRNPGARTLAAALVLLAHVAAYIALRGFHWPTASITWNESPATLLEIEPEPEPPPPPGPDFARPAAHSPPVVLELPDPDFAAPPESIDWLANGARAAADVIAGEGDRVRPFGIPDRPAPQPRRVKPFGWDETHTQRVEVLPGAIAIRLSDRCSVIFAPLPMGGCSLGKIPARGDLFDGMNAAVKLPEWKNSASGPRRWGFVR